MELPLILSGPILRRVEPGLVSVWVALSAACSVRLSLFNGLANAGDPPTFNRPTDAADTLAIGDKLHIAVVMMKLVGADVLKPGQLYSYDLSLTRKSGGPQENLQSLGLLTDNLLSTTPPEQRRLALGYQPNRLPSFALPPEKLTDLKIVHGSCRIQVSGLTDALPWVDDLIKDTHQDPNRRIHQLLLAGDQIYADDVEHRMLPQMIALGQELLNRREFLPTNRPDGLAANFSPADEKNFPAGMRTNLVLSEARMTTVDNRSHLLAFGEWAAMYLYAWNNALWRPGAVQDFDQTIAEFRANYNSRVPESLLPIFRRRDDKNRPKIPDALLRRFTDFVFTTLTADELKSAIKRTDDFDPVPRHPIDADTLQPGALPAPASAARAGFPKIYAFADGLTPEELRAFRAFMEQLKDDLGGLYSTTIDTGRDNCLAALANQHKVRRAMANVPTYMMWDDHEVTDDWNLNPMWRDRVMTTPLGRAIVRNGMLAFALFQGWGNDPDTFRQGSHRRLLDLAAQLYTPTATAASQQAVNDEIERLLGLNRRTADVATPDAQLSWHFSVPGTRHLVVALDNRTQRNWITRGGPPTNILLGLIDRQLPAGPLPGGKDVLFVVAPLPVLGPPMFDELIAPLAYRIFDVKEMITSGNEHLRGMPGTNPDAIEAWAFDPRATEALLKRLEPYRKVVILSGDVHYGSAQAMSYWKRTDPDTDPARFVQFTSSGFKKVLPSYIRDVDLRLSRAQQLIRAQINAERLGWNTKADVLNEKATDAVPALRARLEEAPMLLPAYGWPDGIAVKSSTPPDWSWRISVLLDERSEFNGQPYDPEIERPEAARPPSAGIDIAATPNPIADFRRDFADAYGRLVDRHHRSFDIMRNGRQMCLGCNLGLIHFKMIPDAQNREVLHAIQELRTVFPYELPTASNDHQPFTVHKARLAGEPSETRPVLRAQP